MPLARNPTINVMTAAARKAARRLVRDFGEVEQLQVSRKGPADFVSAADMRAEKTLHDELIRARPNWGFLMEEQGARAGEAAGDRWIIDPLDGTTNFLHGIPHFAISLAHEHDGEIVEAVIYEPISDEMYWAAKGEGAHLNDRRLRVSGRSQMNEALFATGIPYMGRKDHAPFKAQLSEIMEICAGVRRFGSAALDLAYVAAGRYDGYWEMDIEAWDIAAGILLVREAGGFISDAKGKQDMLRSGTIVAGNGHLQGKLLRIVADAAKKAAAHDTGEST